VRAAVVPAELQVTSNARTLDGMRASLLATALLAGCAAGPAPTCPPATSPPAAPVAHHGPLTIATRYCDVEYTAGGLADARVLAAIADRAATAVEKELPFARGALQGVSCRIHQHGFPNALAGDGSSGSFREEHEKEYSVDMNFLALSKHSKTAQTSAGQPMDADYLAKIVYAEFAALALDRGMQQKKSGFRFRDAPEWFRSGYPEYLAITLSSDRYRTVVLPRYIAAVRDDPTRITFAKSIEVKARWNEGAVLIAFLHDTYGKQKLLEMLASDRASFASAFHATLGVEVTAIEPAFNSWVAKY